MHGILDANNFFVSCERVFDPSLENKPVIVLSNNDKCVVARSNEAKAIGIKMCDPVSRLKYQIQNYNIILRSSNYALYHDMSSRMISIAASFVQDLKVESIDEAFLDFNGYDYFDLREYGLKIVKSVTKGTGLPVSLGIAPTRTLAKVAVRFAKKHAGYKGVCVIDSDEKRIKALKLTPIEDVWGIGREYTKLLSQCNIKTAYDFIQLPVGWVRQKMTVIGEKTLKELTGIPCLEGGFTPVSKKSISTSRTFGQTIYELDALKESVSNYASICAEELRSQKSCTVSLVVYLLYRNYRENELYYRSSFITLPVPSSSTIEIVKYALVALKKAYKRGSEYLKAGVILTEVIPDNAIQANLYDKVDRNKHSRLMSIVDKYNDGFMRNELKLAVQMGNSDWVMKQDLRSPCYTTRLSDIPHFKAK